MTPSLFRLALAVPGLVAAAPAFAHAHLVSSSPAAGGTVTAAPAALTLAFSEALNLPLSGVTLRGPDKAPVRLGPARLGPGAGTTLVVPLPGALPPGPYAVEWHALANDGHKTTGTYGFTIRP